MKFTVIGYWGGYPAPNEATSCYLLESGGFSLVIDMGSGALAKLQQYKTVTEIDAVILSHYHFDHVADIGVLQYARLVTYYITGEDKVLPIYGHEEDEAGFQSLTHTYTKGVAYDPKESLEVGAFTISFLKTKHPVPCYGMRITDGTNCIVYTADTSYRKEWIPFAKNADLLITDCNFYADQDGENAGHMTSKQGGKIAEEANVKQLLLSHLPQYGDRNQLIEETKEVFSRTVQLAHAGFIWES
ncbi:MBL fold metallo-hydrolase [Virgibacillus salexigens]|uniref:MBL fold metallo-hydrolase n=1 Tax=Virgibacillus massiliensis TaxID=1462526 RepID=UPI00136E95EE|nr:MBL fold metallo-hydrolase [Virgibacillus massiliensis]MYL42796.1 MBL fold metallo-hydrolase [Virgibacillus massiliensis]